MKLVSCQLNYSSTFGRIFALYCKWKPWNEYKRHQKVAMFYLPRSPKSPLYPQSTLYFNNGLPLNNEEHFATSILTIDNSKLLALAIYYHTQVLFCWVGIIIRYNLWLTFSEPDWGTDSSASRLGMLEIWVGDSVRLWDSQWNSTLVSAAHQSHVIFTFSRHFFIRHHFIIKPVPYLFLFSPFFRGNYVKGLAFLSTELAPIWWFQAVP